MKSTEFLGRRRQSGSVFLGSRPLLESGKNLLIYKRIGLCKNLWTYKKVCKLENYCFNLDISSVFSYNPFL